MMVPHVFSSWTLGIAFHSKQICHTSSPLQRTFMSQCNKYVKLLICMNSFTYHFQRKLFSSILFLWTSYNKWIFKVAQTHGHTSGVLIILLPKGPMLSSLELDRFTLPSLGSGNLAVETRGSSSFGCLLKTD